MRYISPEIFPRLWSTCVCLGPPAVRLQRLLPTLSVERPSLGSPPTAAGRRRVRKYGRHPVLCQNSALLK